VKVLVKIVGLLVLGTGNVGCHNRSWLKSNINHHLEHVDNIILNTVALEVGALLIEVHLHVTTRHLDHTVVDSLIGVLKSLKVSVLKSKHGT
jgi:hypothetical protein